MLLSLRRTTTLKRLGLSNVGQSYPTFCWAKTSIASKARYPLMSSATDAGEFPVLPKESFNLLHASTTIDLKISVSK